MKQQVWSHDPLVEVELRPSILPILGDHHLPYVVPVVVYWVISVSDQDKYRVHPANRDGPGLLFHYIDTKGLLSAYKLHTPAEDLTKNRATKTNVIKFALLQQALQCTLGYLTAADEPFVPHEYAIAGWAQTIRYGGLVATHWLRHCGLEFAWIVKYSQESGSGFPGIYFHDNYGNSIHNSSEFIQLQTAMVSTYPSTPAVIAAKIIYWVLVPLFQYISVMIVADTMQYFTHRAFHVNKWLYSEPPYDDSKCFSADARKWNMSTQCIMMYMFHMPTALSTTIHWRPYQSTWYSFPCVLQWLGSIIAKLPFLVPFGLSRLLLITAGTTCRTIRVILFALTLCSFTIYSKSNLTSTIDSSFAYAYNSHQSWGMKYNFSVYGSFWDRQMGTHWSPLNDVAQEKYKRGRATAETLAAKKILGDRALDMTDGKSTAVAI